VDVAGARAVPRTWILAVVVAAVAVYANSLGGTLLYDDVNAIRDNPYIVNGNIGGILTEPTWWGNGRGRLWRPVTSLSFVANHALHGLEPFGYHVVNVAAHALVSVLVLLVFAATTGPRTGLAAALLFATHPIHTEAVSNIVGRAEIFAAGGFLLAWWCWIAADAATARRSGAATTWIVATAVAYFLAMLSKENAIALPAVLLFADVLGRRDETLAALLRRRAPRYAVLLAVAVVVVALRGAVSGQVTPRADLLDNPLSALSAGSRLATAVKVIGLYALRLVFPLWLSADYSFDQIAAVSSPLDPGFLGGLVVVLGLPALAWWTWRRLPGVALGIGVLMLTFAIVSNLAFLIGTIMGERLVYLPSVGFCVAVAAGLVWLAGERAAAPGSTRWSAAFVAPLAVIAALYGARTVARNTVWREPLVFFETMVVDAPRSARSHRELGTALTTLRRFPEAAQEFERSLAIKPEDSATLYNYGNALGSEGRFDEAAAMYRRAVAVNPEFGQAYENLGNAESMRGDQQAALAAFRRAHELTPESPFLLMNLANTLFRAGSMAEARTTYEQARAQAPRSPEILTNYGSFLYAQGDYATAAAVLADVPSPAPARALVALAASCQQLGRMSESQSAIATALRLYPRDPDVRQMAEALRQRGVSP
jgi:Flp pilus assembly protein TadD